MSIVIRSLPQSTNEVLGEVRAGNQNRPENDEEEAKATNGGSRVYAFGRGQVVNQYRHEQQQPRHCDKDRLPFEHPAEVLCDPRKWWGHEADGCQ